MIICFSDLFAARPYAPDIKAFLRIAQVYDTAQKDYSEKDFKNQKIPV